ncbi:MAG: tetratricopeptide repeat protein [Bacteroidales bacterium]|nr:tetratricopeptide repeat protein [Bacteroidales bacterium]
MSKILTRKIKILIILTCCLSMKSQAQVADSLQNLLDLADHDTVRVNLFNQLSVYFSDNNPEKSMEFAGKALIVAKRKKYEEGEAYAYLNISTAQMNMGNFQGASEYLFEALRIEEELENKEGIAFACAQIGVINFHLGNYENSLEFLYRANKLNFELNDKQNLARVFNNIGAVYFSQGNYESAVDLFQKSLRLNQELGNRDWEADNLGNIGEIYLERNDPESLVYFRRKLEIKKILNAKHGIARAHDLIGAYFMKNKIYDSALYYLETGLDIAREIKYQTLQKDLVEKLARSYAEVEQYGAATLYYNELLDLMNKLSTEQSSNTMARLDMEYNFSKEMRGYELERQKQQRNYALIALVLVLLILVAAWLFVGQKRKVKHVELRQEHLKLEQVHLKEQIEYKDKELVTNVMYQVKKNELLTVVVDKLKKSKYNFKKENHSLVDGIISDISDTLKDDIWEDFEMRFKEVHSSFYRNLEKKFGELTPNEKKLCAFIRLGMSTKEIAAITQQSVNSLEVARTRLRKKLKISNKDVNLAAFLSRF